MKLLWIKWAGGTETRNDGFTIYRDLRYTSLIFPNGNIERYRTVTEAKGVADKKEVQK